MTEEIKAAVFHHVVFSLLPGFISSSCQIGEAKSKYYNLLHIFGSCRLPPLQGRSCFEFLHGGLGSSHQHGSSTQLFTYSSLANFLPSLMFTLLQKNNHLRRKCLFEGFDALSHVTELPAWHSSSIILDWLQEMRVEREVSIMLVQSPLK